ncbi:hypothetical protein [Demequina aestuarii]|uniref:hypothetical protein n=1 Tax=Demequina aestuarii TaxID=327095 RepID=UPI000A9A03BC|nr:hypothetical protein [Demequina aestuarii]
MSPQHDHPSQERIPSPDESPIPELETDQSIAPRPEEEMADALRAKTDDEDSQQSE